MGFPFDQATWNAVEGAMFVGFGGITPGVYTFLGVVACIVILFIGNKSEKKRYKIHEEREDQAGKSSQ